MLWYSLEGCYQQDNSRLHSGPIEKAKEFVTLDFQALNGRFLDAQGEAEDNVDVWRKPSASFLGAVE